MRNNTSVFRILICTLLMALISGSYAAEPASDAMKAKHQWVLQHLQGKGNPPPFSFIYGGQPSKAVLKKGWRSENASRLDANRLQRITTWTNDSLQVKCIAVEYSDFPAVEWTVYCSNIGSKPTALLEDIQGLDVTLSRKANDPEFTLNGIKGDWTTADSFEPYQRTLKPSTVSKLSPLSYSGKSSSGPDGWPYYNLQTPGGGIMMAIGWPGQWASSFTRDAAGNLRIQAGQELTHLSLKPGEEIRTPLIAMLFWRGTDVVRAQNLWRRWYMAHVIPKVDGKPLEPVTQIQVDGSDTNNVLGFLNAGIHPDICWRDAGGSYTWYPNSTGPYKGDDSWLNTGTWEVDSKRYPQGFKPYSDWIHSRGIKFLLWFEPERVGDPGSWLGTNHPEWLLPGNSPVKEPTTAHDAKLHAQNQGNTHGKILNEGHPAAFNWLTNHITQLIKAQGIDWYREDMNGDGPLPAWRNNDAPDRQGITENLYVQGHLAYWDALRAMNPGLQIDSCASGGRRNDLETMRRAVPFTRSDFQFLEMKDVVEGNQCHTYGLAFWLPYQGSGCRFYDPYSFRTFYMAEFGMCAGISPANQAAQVQAYTECKKVAPLMLNGDYYPLTPYSMSKAVWIGWQFDWPEKGQGCVQVFRRADSNEEARTFTLNGLNPAATYELTNLDSKAPVQMSGKELLEKGLTIRMSEKPGSAIVIYKRVERK